MREVTKENSWGLQQLWVSVSFQLWFGSPGWGFYCRTRRLLHDLSSSLWLIDLWAKSGRFFPAMDVRSSLGCSGISAGPAARWGLRGFCGPSVCGGLPFPSPDWRGERTAVGKLLCRREHLGSPLVLIDCHPTLMRSRTSARCNGCSLRVTIVGRLCLRNCAQQMWGEKKKNKNLRSNYSCMPGNPYCSYTILPTLCVQGHRGSRRWQPSHLLNFLLHNLPELLETMVKQAQQRLFFLLSFSETLSSLPAFPHQEP